MSVIGPDKVDAAAGNYRAFLVKVTAPPRSPLVHWLGHDGPRGGAVQMVDNDMPAKRWTSLYHVGGGG
ncbi:MAG TPA: hypothetical protein VG096_15320 [Bryobacteraceae bacterium]|jgi:hypothetical protein|nr:hypothetical protein [Bryobacteraceae bacterium]